MKTKIYKIKNEGENMNLKELYNNGTNIMRYFRENTNSEANSVDAILVSYDLQAGSYIDFVESNKSCDNFHINGNKTTMNTKEYVQEFCKYVASEIDKFEYSSILEAGVGEATSFNFVMQNLKNKDAKKYGFDLAPSRIKKGMEYLDKYKTEADLFVGNLLETPFGDNSFDIVYTIHALEPNTKNAMKIVQELLRITNKYLLLFEPSYELGNQATKDNIDRNKYIKNLYNDVKTIPDIEILKYELCPIGTYSNQPAIMVIKKLGSTSNNGDTKYSCPICHRTLTKSGENYYCDECMFVYPVIQNIPLLTRENGILFTQYLK